MPERSPERKPQAPPLVQAVEATQQFIENLENEDIFKEAVKKVKSKLGEGDPKKLNEVASSFVKNGISMAMSHVGLLPAFSNPEKRNEIIENAKKEKKEIPRVEIFATWNVNQDPMGIGVLKACKQKDIEEILEKKKEAENPEQEKQIELQANAASIGQDIVIGYFKNQGSKASSHHLAA